MHNPEQFNNDGKQAEREWVADLKGEEKAKITRLETLYNTLNDPSRTTILDIPLEELPTLIMAAREHTPGDGLPAKEHNTRLIKELIREGNRLEGRDQAA